MLKPCPSRWFYFAQLLVIAGLLGFAFYLEFYQGLVPCAMCEMQRLAFAVLGFLFLVSSFFPLQKYIQVFFILLLSLSALFGTVFAGRQLWLQYFPSPFDSGSCEASLQYMAQILPWPQVLMSVFLGGPECAKVNWQFLHLSMAAWSLLWFLFFFLLALLQGLGWLFYGVLNTKEIDS